MNLKFPISVPLRYSVTPCLKRTFTDWMFDFYRGVKIQ